MPRAGPPRAAGAAVLMAGLLVATAAPALAGLEEGMTVTFEGSCGLFGLSADATPDTSQLSVAAEETVQFVNHTGQPATLQIDGEAAGSLGADEALPVVFHRGPVSVTMAPDCPLSVSSSLGAVTVEVVAARATPVGGRKPTVHPSRRGPGRATPGPPQDAMVSPAVGDQADLTAGTGLGDPDGGAGSGDPGAAVEGATAGAGKVNVAAPVPATPARRGADGLLGLVAMVFVVGVSAGIIRAIHSQRAPQTIPA